MSLSEYPDNLQLLYVKASLEEGIFGAERALVTIREMLTIWTTLFKAELEQEVFLDSPTQGMTECHSLFNLSDKDTGT